MDLKKFFGELRRRNVYKVAVAYAIVAWLLVQVATQVFPFFEVPNWAIRLVVLLLVIGFVVALVFSWAFELTAEGLKRTEDVDVTKSVNWNAQEKTSATTRSEEHTSELQSRGHLVCRLLLEKKMNS